MSDETAKVAYNSFLVSDNSNLLIGVAKKVSNVKIVDNRERYAYYVILKALAYRDDLNFCTVRKLTPKSLYNSTIEEVIKNYRPKWFEICNSNIKLSIRGKSTTLQVDVANFTNVSKILTTVMRYGINVDSFSLNVLLGYLKFICYKDFNLFNAIMSLGKRLKMRYNL